jgi:bifunctional DNA-binding transcriptional regulator/antitoxin component of YhaV-PrlF toxin-antitoxin module
MKQSDRRVVGRCFGTAVLGPRGQLVIPVEARKELGLDTGNRFLVFGHFEELGLILIKVEAAENLLDIITSRLDEIARVVKESKTTEVGIRDGENPA